MHTSWYIDIWKGYQKIWKIYVVQPVPPRQLPTFLFVFWPGVFGKVLKWKQKMVPVRNEAQPVDFEWFGCVLNGATNPQAPPHASSVQNKVMLVRHYFLYKMDVSYGVPNEVHKHSFSSHFEAKFACTKWDETILKKKKAKMCTKCLLECTKWPLKRLH